MVKKVNAIDTSELVKKTDYNAKIKNIEDAKISDLDEKIKTIATKEEIKTLATKAELKA